MANDTYLAGGQPVLSEHDQQKMHFPTDTRGRTKYQYGGYDAATDYLARVGEARKYMIDEDSAEDVDALMSTYDYNLYELANNVFNDRLDKDTEHWRTNDNVMYLQNYLATIGTYEGDIDGLYGEKTKQALKEYIYNNSGIHAWQGIKKWVGDIFE